MKIFQTKLSVLFELSISHQAGMILADIFCVQKFMQYCPLAPPVCVC